MRQILTGAIAIGSTTSSIIMNGMITSNSGITFGVNDYIYFGTNTENPPATTTVLGSVFTGTYLGAGNALTSGNDYVVSTLTNVPIGVYIGTGCSSISSSTNNWSAREAKIQIVNGVIVYGSFQLASFTGTTALDKLALSCCGIIAITSISTISLIVNATFTTPVIRNIVGNQQFNFRLVRIG